MTLNRTREKTLLLPVLLLLTALFSLPAAAEDAPRLFDPNDRLSRPDLSGLPRLRFLTTLDFPPFNFADTQGKAAGFNIDLARALCRELRIEAKCEIQAMPWDELDATLDGRRGEAIIAGHRITTELRAGRDLTAPYFRFPARFAGRKGFVAKPKDFLGAVRDKKVAVVSDSAHAAMLADWFPETVPVPVADMEAAYSALTTNETDLIFGDGVVLSYWLASAASRSCCQFLAGPFMSDYFLGAGMTIVLRDDSKQLRAALNAGLKAIEENGVFNEIYIRYFPLSPFAGFETADPSESGKRKAERPEETG